MADGIAWESSLSRTLELSKNNRLVLVEFSSPA
ncbi:hypothetical protein BMS3Abin10_00730 [bacterium BMS3Abin10]|nr:hypothetical protein BMS3Abin10_00730 [bacterium BMS3Abin10]